MRQRILGLVAAVALAPAGCGDDGTPSAAATDDDAGGWSTWVLQAPGEVRVPAPHGAPGETRAPDPEAPAVKPWLEQAMTLVARRPKDPVTASRNYALVAVAMYDAAVAAEHWQEEHARATYPAAETAIAGAASRVVAHAFPEHPAALLEEDAERTAAAVVRSGATREEARAGLALGRAVAARVIDRARRSGSDRVWRGRLPRFEGAWRPPPGSAARPVAPLAGTWRTWVLRDGREVRPEPPPEYGSEAFMDEVRAVVETSEALTEEQKRIAEFWAGGDGTELPPGRWIKVVLEYLRDRPPMSEARVARIFALLNVAMDDAGVAAWDAKYAYWVTRPENAIRDLVDPDWRPYLDTPFFPAYVSGHATYSGAAAEVLAHLFAQDADLWRARAREAAQSRVFGGIHFPMDGEVGLRMGVEIGRKVVARARRDGAGT